MSNAALVDEHNRLLQLNLKCAGGGAWTILCCGYEHEACRFISGSLYCVRANCPNPHHRLLNQGGAYAA